MKVYLVQSEEQVLLNCGVFASVKAAHAKFPEWEWQGMHGFLPGEVEVDLTISEFELQGEL